MKLFTVGYSYSWKYNRLQGKAVQSRGTTYFLVRHFTFVTKLGMSRNLLGLGNKEKKENLKGARYSATHSKAYNKMACCLQNIKFRINNKLIITQFKLFKSPYKKEPTGCTIYFQLVYTNCCIYRVVDCVWNVMAHAQKPDFVFRWNGRVHLNRRGRQFSRILAAEVCGSAVVMLDVPCSEVV
jgi:hypothetical protein